MSKFKVARLFHEKRDGDLPTIGVNPSRSCNYNCPFCYIHEKQRSGDERVDIDTTSQLSLETIDRLVSDMKQLNTRGCVLSGGGEPTMNPHVAHMTREMFSNDMQVGLITNGSLLRPELDTWARCLTFARVSMDAWYADDYARVKGVSPKKFDRVVDNILALKHATSTCRVGVAYTLGPDSINDIRPAVDFFINDVGVDYLQFRDRFIFGYEIVGTIKRQLLDEIEACNGSGRVIYEPPHDGNTRCCKDCQMTNYRVDVCANGDVKPCPHTSTRLDLSYGNVNDESLVTIWNRVNNDIFSDDELVEKCRFQRQNEILDELNRMKDVYIV